MDHQKLAFVRDSNKNALSHAQRGARLFLCKAPPRGSRALPAEVFSAGGRSEQSYFQKPHPKSLSLRLRVAASAKQGGGEGLKCLVFRIFLQWIWRMQGFFFVKHPITDHEIILTSPSSFLMGSFLLYPLNLTKIGILREIKN